MRFDPELRPAVFLHRENRYLAWVDLGAGPEAAHVPNSGAMAELLVPGRPALVAPVDRLGRKSRYDLTLIRHEDRWISVDARLPPLLVLEALASGMLALPGFPPELRREVCHGRSRFDLAGRDGEGRLCLVEAKSVNLVAEGRALFPDVPTARGARHCRHLAELAGQGCLAAIVFVLQRDDAYCLSPHHTVDPDFASALAEAFLSGVAVRAIRCRITPEEIVPVGEIPVLPDPAQVQ